MAESSASAWDKGARLAVLVSQHDSLLILDGLEPLQFPPGPQVGELMDDGLKALFSGLVMGERGLCVVTSRERLTDLSATEASSTPCRPLDHLTDDAGAAVLRGHGVSGSVEELRQASHEVRGHALTVSLMGQFLKLAFEQPDIAQRDCFKFGTVNKELQNGHAFRVFAAYEQWLLQGGRIVEVAILRLLGLFDRPATPDCLAALCAEPLPSLNEPLLRLGKQDWTMAVNRLKELGLLETVPWQPVSTVMGYGEESARAEMAAGRRRQTTNIGEPQPHPVPAVTFPLRQSLDAHPLLREYFAERLRGEPMVAFRSAKERLLDVPSAAESSEDASATHRSFAERKATIDTYRAAQSRLFEHLRQSVPYWPEGREGLLPLYQAVAHGCLAGRFQEACDDVYRNRILRGTAGTHAAYSTKKLGLLSLDLAAVACFFVEPWSRLAESLAPADQAWLLSEAAFRLRALNRLTEAREAMRANLTLRMQQENWTSCAITASNLSELELTLGEVAAAEATAAQSVTFADRSQDEFRRMGFRTTHADALHQAGRRDESRSLFAEAETLQFKRQPSYPLIYSVQGYRYCDVLLAAAERAAWQSVAWASSPCSSGAAKKHGLEAHATALADVERRATQTLEWVTKARMSLLTIALDQLTLGRVLLLRAVLSGAATAERLGPARDALDTALHTLRLANSTHHLPRALLPSAWCLALQGEWGLAEQRLNEAFQLATRGGNDPTHHYQGGMRLHLIDTLLHRARLFGRRMDTPVRPPADSAEAGVGSTKFSNWRGEDSASEGDSTSRQFRNFEDPTPRCADEAAERKTAKSGPPTNYPWRDSSPQADLALAAQLIEVTGYHRRDEELADAQAVFK